MQDMFVCVCHPQIGYTALHCAASTNQLHVLQYLLRNSESCNVKLLSFYDETPLLVACLNNHLDAVGLLVDREADLHAVDRKENTALHLSAAGGSCAIIDYIIVEKQCTDLLNQTNRVGFLYTRLCHILSMSENNILCEQMLL